MKRTSSRSLLTGVLIMGATSLVASPSHASPLHVGDLGTATKLRSQILTALSAQDPQLDKSSEGKCGEGKCGEGKCGDDSEDDGSAGSPE